LSSISDLERRIRTVESALILLSIAAIAGGDYLFGPHVSLGFLYLIPLSYSAITHRWPTLLGLVTLCVVLRQVFGPIAYSSWGLIVRDWLLVAIFLAVVVSLNRLGKARGEFFRTAREQRDELVREVEMAARTQRHLLAQHVPPEGSLDVVARTEPAQVVGGDYYDFIPLDEGRFAVVVVDVAGKGLPAALIMPAVKIALRTLAVRHAETSEALREANEIFLDNLPTASYFTLFYGVFDPGRGRLVYANAGHQPVLHLQARTGDVAWLKTGGAAVGLIPDVAFETAELDFESGDVFVFYTDGITEAEAPDGADFGSDRLVAVVRTHRERPAAEIVDAVHAAAEAFRGPGARGDDSTVIVVRVP
jgi:sigma-B regulation protein RsbU (phosphoserine phosphatase)